MNTFPKAAISIALIVSVGAAVFQFTRAERLRAEVDALQRQQLLANERLQQAKRDDETATTVLAALRARPAGTNQDARELMRLRGEVSQLRRQLAMPRGGDGLPAGASSHDPDSTLDTLAVNHGRELGLAAARGEPGALDKIRELAKAQLASFNTNGSALNDTLRGELARRTFAPLHAAFKAIEEAVAGGDHEAILAVARALRVPELKGSAVSSLGVLAGQGNEAALGMLLNPEQNGLLLSSTISALQPAAEAGNQQAIDAYAAVASEPKNQALWLLAADGLAKPAAAGNPVAIDALVRLSASTNVNVRRAVTSALQGVDPARNPKVANALRALTVP